MIIYGQQVLSSSQDQTARIHGLRSGKTLKDFRGHSSFVNTAIFTKDSHGNVMTGSADGSVKLWDSRTTECLFSYSPGAHVGKDYAVIGVFPTYRADHYAICGRYVTNIIGFLHIMGWLGPTRSMSSPPQDRRSSQ